MSKSHHIDTMGEFLGSTGKLFLAWVGTWTVSEFNALIGGLSGLVLLGYTLYKWYALWQWKRRQDAGAPATDPPGTGNGGL